MEVGERGTLKCSVCMSVCAHVSHHSGVLLVLLCADLWKFQLNSTTAPLEIKRQWACGYQTLAPVCGQFTTDTDQDFSDFPDKFKKQSA